MTVNVTSLPGLPTASSNSNAVLVAESLERWGKLKGLSDKNKQKLIAKVTQNVGPQLDAQRAVAHDGRVSDFMVDKTVGKGEFDSAMKKSNRRSWFVASAGFVVGMAASGALNIGVERLFHLFHRCWADSINTALSPALFTISAGIVGAITALFIEKLTTPLNALFTRLAFSGSPIKSHIDSKVGASFIDAYNGANQIDGRVFTTAATMNSMIMNLEATLTGTGGVRQLLREARGAKSLTTKQELVQEAAEQFAGKLILAEISHFHIDPMFQDIFSILHQVSGTTFERLDVADVDAFENAAIEFVRKHRPNEADGGRPDNEKAIEGYYKPFLHLFLRGAAKTGSVDA